MVGIDVESDQYVEATSKLTDLDSLTALYTATGDHMLMAELEATGSTELNEIVSNQILSIQGVTTACPAVLQERLK
jgi:AsnC family.